MAQTTVDDALAASAVSASNTGKNAADIETNSAANKRSAFIISP